MSEVYKELLNTPEWREIRELVISRDRNKCQLCHNDNILNHLEPFISIGSRSIANGYFYRTITFRGDVYWVDKENKSHESETKQYLYLINKEAKPQGMFINYVAKIDIGKQITEPKISATISLEEIGNIAHNHYKNEINKFYSNLNNQILSTHEWDWLMVKGLHVHHSYYQMNKRPWEYPLESLITYCADCHEKVHKTQKIPVVDENFKILSNDHLNVCWKCKGIGFLPEYHYYLGGVCFGCNGSRYI